jgi:hypothetical protein
MEVMKEKSPSNPWLSMWTKPRETIQSIVDRNPEQSVLLLASLSGISQALDKASTKSTGDTYPLLAVILLCIASGAISGIISLYLAGFLLKHAGHWLGGKADGDRVRAAIAWSSVPVAWALLLWLPELAIFGKDLFSSTTPRIDAQPVLYFSFLAVELIIAIWAIVIFFKSLSQVHRFSVWRSIGATLIAVALIAVPILLIALAFGAFK